MATQRKQKPKISPQAMMGEIKTLAMLTGGVILGSVGGKVIDKILKVDNSAAGFNAKSLTRPVVIIGLGAAGNLLLKDPNLKLIATGVGASGILTGVKVFMKKDLLSGLSDFSFKGIGEIGESNFYREPVNLSIERYNPDLPALSSPTSLNQDSQRPTNTESVTEEELAYIEII